MARKQDGGETKSLADQWRDAERAYLKIEQDYNAAKELRDKLASELSHELITVHRCSRVDLDGVKYDLKRSATRRTKGEDGAETTKTPKYPYQLVRVSEKATAAV